MTVAGEADTAAPEGVASPGPRSRQGVRRPWRSIVFAPVGDGSTRRRGSDGLRVGAAALTLLCCWLITYAPASAQTAVVHVTTSVPTGVKWCVSVVWWVGTVGTVVVLGILALLSGRREVVRDLLVAGIASYALALGIQLLIGPNGGHAPTSQLAGVNLGFPLGRIAAAMGVATAALPYLSRAFRRIVELAIAVAAVATVVHGSGLPISVLASVAIGWGTTAVVHLIFGSPLGLPSANEVRGSLQDLGVRLQDLSPMPGQVWGVARYNGHDAAGPLDVCLYGRDAHDAQLLAKTYRYMAYRDSGPTLALTRIQQVEHEAYITLMAARAGARVPAIIAAGIAGPARDAVLVTRPPVGSRLSTALPTEPPPSADVPPEGGSGDGAGGGDPSGSGGSPPADGDGSVQSAAHAVRVAERPVAASTSSVAVTEPVTTPWQGAAPDLVSDRAAGDLFRQMTALQRAGIAHGAISPETVIVGPGGTTGLVDFRNGTSSTPQEKLDRDLAAALATMAYVIGPERTVNVAAESVPLPSLAQALPFLQRAALDSVASRALRGRKDVLVETRERGAHAAGVEVPKLAEPRRISWATLILIVGSLIGGWALIGVLVNVTKSWSTITGADWGWVAVVFILSQLVYPSLALTTTGSVVDPLPYGRVVALEVANTFVSLAAGSMGALATRVRFFQQDGYDATLAVSSGVLASTVSWIVKGALFLIALPLALSQFHFGQEPTSGGSKAKDAWLILIVVLGIAVLVGVVLLVPRLRRLFRDKLWPKAGEVWGHLKVLSAHPRNLVEIFGGSLVAQLLVAMALGASLHAFGAHLSLAALLIVLTLGSMLGGVSPVPGGMGIVEAGMILALTAAGIPESIAVAAVFVQRLFTAYLPPIWGWFTLVWLRKKEYL